MLDRDLSPRQRALLTSPWLPWLLVGLVYACGIAVRAIYTLQIQRAEDYLFQDMFFYVSLGRKFIAAGGPTDPGDVMVPLGYPTLLSFLLSGTGSLARVVNLQLFLSSLVPLLVGGLGAAAYGRRTGMIAVMFASLYFPFIEYGALMLTEIHFIFWLTFSFALLFAGIRVRGRGAGLGLAAAAGVSLSVAAAFKSVALPAAFLLAVVEGFALLLARPAGSPAPTLRRMQPWVVRWAVVGIAAAPLLIAQARVCTRANEGNFCVTGNKIGSDLLLGHYGRIGAMEWTPPGGGTARFGSPGSYLRRYEATARVPFAMSDNAANTKEAFRWIWAHPGEALLFSVDHVYDLFFGAAMWPGYGHPSWPFAHLSQYIFIAFLFIPLVPACAGLLRRGARAALTGRTAMVLAPVAALTLTVMYATGEVRYRIPFDVFLIVAVCAYATGDMRRIDGTPAITPSGTGAGRSRS